MTLEWLVKQMVEFESQYAGRPMPPHEIRMGKEAFNEYMDLVIAGAKKEGIRDPTYYVKVRRGWFTSLRFGGAQVHLDEFLCDRTVRFALFRDVQLPSKEDQKKEEKMAPWKIDEATGVEYKVIGDYVIIARNLRYRDEIVKSAITGREVKIKVAVGGGDPYILFRSERKFSDGTVALDERDSVHGGIFSESAKKVVTELLTAIHQIQAMFEDAPKNGEDDADRKS
jgi:hypothetical protein